MTDSTEARPEGGVLENRVLLMNPARSPQRENETPPLEAIVGVWAPGRGRKPGRFRPDPDHVPADGRAPSDPLVTMSPDDLPCVVVATGEVHRRRTSSPRWRRMDLDDEVADLYAGLRAEAEVERWEPEGGGGEFSQSSGRFAEKE